MSTPPPPSSLSNGNEEKHEETSTTDICDIEQDTDIVAVEVTKSNEEVLQGRSSAGQSLPHSSVDKSEKNGLDGPEIIYDDDFVDGFRHDLDEKLKHDAADDLLKQGGNFLPGAANKAAPEVTYDNDAPFSLESDKSEESDPPIGNSRVRSVAEIDVVNRDPPTPPRARSVARDAPDQTVRSHDAATGTQRAPSPHMVDAVAVHVMDDIFVDALPMDQPKSHVLTNSTKKRWFGLMVVVLLIVAAVVTAVVVTTAVVGTRDEPPQPLTASPSQPLTASPSQSPTSVRNQAITNAVIALSGDSALTTTTSQHLALTWLLEEDEQDLSADDPRLIQRYVLALMYYSLGGDNWYDKHLFLSEYANECIWGKNFECNNNSIITTIDLSKNNLEGSLPSEISALESLETLSLESNTLFRNIPQTLTLLSTLRYLNLFNNSLAGSIPESIADMSSLEWLEIYNNQLTGTIPTSIGNLANLKALSVCTNKLEGLLPSKIGRLTKLELLFVCENRFTGTFPTTIGQLTNLTSLQAHTSSMNGPIPSEVGRLTKLGQLGFNENKFTGTLPTELGQLLSLTSLYAYTNFLGGAIPSEIGNLAKLEALSVFGNKLTGTVPTEIGSMAKLTIISISDNELTGSVPTAICNFNLTYFEADCLSGLSCPCCTICS